MRKIQRENINMKPMKGVNGVAGEVEAAVEEVGTLGMDQDTLVGHRHQCMVNMVQDGQGFGNI